MNEKEIRLECLKLAIQISEKSENIIYDKSFAEGQDIGDLVSKNSHIGFDVRGRGIQNAVMTYKNMSIEKVIEKANEFYSFVSQ